MISRLATYKIFDHVEAICLIREKGRTNDELREKGALFIAKFNEMLKEDRIPKSFLFMRALTLPYIAEKCNYVHRRLLKKYIADDVIDLLDVDLGYCTKHRDSVSHIAKIYKSIKGFSYDIQTQKEQFFR
ncbi:hypothetical protein RF11_13928 [Thelohanellus kitauei]|uniref:Uncharacterized protein n=1 Tax=Thelohanellus kitauei TaxID=669202 RepID=A0A0C2M1K5_THEKT|nr:hypothetical protein RF11_13928 [Thelohanellus kitauei]